MVFILKRLPCRFAESQKTSTRAQQQTRSSLLFLTSKLKKEKAMNEQITMEEKEKLNADIHYLTASMSTLNLATLNDEGEPEASYAPFLYTEPFFFVFVSQLSSHTTNLINRPIFSLMVIEDESGAANLHARQRLILRCHAEQLHKNHEHAPQILNRMEQKLGNTMKMIRQLPDFYLFRLRVVNGRFVKGFGAAFGVDSRLRVTNLLKGT